MITNEKISVTAKFGPVSLHTKRMIFKMIDKSFSIPGSRHQYTDKKRVSYCVSYEERKLTISVVDNYSFPNASILPMLEDRFGTPTFKYAKPYTYDPKATIFFMAWDDFFRGVEK